MGDLLTDVEFWKALPALIWPAIAIGFLWAFWPVLRGILVSRKFTIKVGSFELSAQEASDQMQKSVSELQTRMAEIETRLTEAAEDAPGDRARHAGPKTLETGLAQEREAAPPALQAKPFLILWVDDQPRNNAGEAQTLREIGCTITDARSTDEAMRFLDHQSFDLVISDIGRPEGRDAGVALVETLRERGSATPVALYSSRGALARYAERIGKCNVVVATVSFVELLKAVKRLKSDRGR